MNSNYKAVQNATSGKELGGEGLKKGDSKNYLLLKRSQNKGTSVT